MLRRFIAAVGIFAYGLAFLPAGVGWCAAAEPMPCCVGKMCPMLHHHATAKHSDCGMPGMGDTASTRGDSGAYMFSCPCTRELRYVGALFYVLATPPSQAFSSPVAALHVVLAAATVAPFFEIVPPPPRSIPA